MGDKPTAEETRLWQTRLAAQANNRAWALSEAISRSAAEDEDMLQAAHAAMYFWRCVGDDRQQAHAAQLLAHVYAHLDLAQPARHYLDKSALVFQQLPGDPWEQALAQAVAANVAAAAGERALHVRHHQEATRLTAELADDEERAIVNATLHAIAKPGDAG